jgi:hypothetical protein
MYSATSPACQLVPQRIINAVCIDKFINIIFNTSHCDRSFSASIFRAGNQNGIRLFIGCFEHKMIITFSIANSISAFVQMALTFQDFK